VSNEEFIQFQAVSGPVYTPASESPVTVDMWNHHPQNPIVKASTIVSIVVISQLMIEPILPAQATPLDWITQNDSDIAATDEPIYPQNQVPLLGIPFVGLIDCESVGPVFQEITFYQISTDLVVVPPAAAPPTTTIDRWYAPPPEYISDLDRVMDESLYAPDPSTFVTPTVPDMDWLQNAEIPIYIPDQPIIDVSVLDPEPPTVPPSTVSIDQWGQPIYQPFGILPGIIPVGYSVPPIQPETITIDKWYQPVSQPQFDEPFIAVDQPIKDPTTPVSVPLATIDWFVQAPEIVRIEPYADIETPQKYLVTPAPVTLAIIDWFVEAMLPGDVEPIQHVDALLITYTAPKSIPVLDWLQNSEMPQFIPHEPIYAGGVKDLLPIITVSGHTVRLISSHRLKSKVGGGLAGL